jgi:hypothetical protein
MLIRGLLFAPVTIAVLYLVGGPDTALSGAVGYSLTLLNLWVAGRIIGGIAENAPHLLMGAALAALTFSLVTLTVAAILLRRLDVIDFTVTGVTLVVSHLVLVTWEAANSLLKIPSDQSLSGSASVRS